MDDKDTIDCPAPMAKRSRNRFALPSMDRNAIWMLAGNIVYSAARYMVFVILAQLGSEKTVGEYRYAVAFCLPTITIFRFGLRILVSTDARRQHRFSEYLAFSLVSTCLAGLVVGGLIVCERLSLNGLDLRTAILIALVCAWNGLESISDCFAGLFQQRERMDLIARSFAIQAIAMTLLLAAGLYLFDDLLIGVMGLIVAAAIRLLAYEVPVTCRLLTDWTAVAQRPRIAEMRHIFSQTQWTTARQIVITGAPLTIVTFLLAFTESLPAYFIADVLGKSPLGVFAGLYALANVQSLFVLSITQSMVSRLATYYTTGERQKFANAISKTVLLAIGCGVLGFGIARFIGRQLLTIVYNSPAYAAENNCFQILIIAGAVVALGHVIGSAVSSMRRFHVQVPAQLIKLVIMYVGCALVVERYGLEGVAWVVTVSATVSLLAYLFLFSYGLRRISSPSGFSNK
ncbi:MAG: oligosaccharide flippase family protein [Pirellulales bacterium]|nr:oligosaccharide flippase family protein [Pirellulales bacterium]